MNDNITDSASEIATLRNQVFTLFLALIVVSGTLTTFVYYQSRQTSKQIAVAEKTIEDLKKNDQNVNAFVGQLLAYGQRDANFLPVLKKYGLPLDKPAAAPAAAPKK